MKLDLKEKLESYGRIKIHCKNQKHLLDVIEIIESEKLKFHYWMPGSVFVSVELYFSNLRKMILGTEYIEPYVPENSQSVVTLSKKKKSVELTVSTTPEKIRYDTYEQLWSKEPKLEIDYSLLIREHLLSQLEI